MKRPYRLSEDGLAARSARSQETRDALMAAAAALFAAEGYDGVSVTEIARKAEVSASLINAYFDGKAGLLYALVEANNAPQEQLSRDIAEGGGPPLDRLRAILTEWARQDLRDPRVLQVMHAYSWQWSAETEARNGATRAIFIGFLARVIADAQAAGLVATAQPPDLLADALFALYTWKMRDAVYLGWTPEAALEALWPQAMALLKPA